MAVEINEIEYSQWVLWKLNHKHRLTIDDVFDAVEHHVSADWEDDEEHGLRLLVRGWTENGRLLRIILYPIDVAAGTFLLGSAF